MAIKKLYFYIFLSINISFYKCVFYLFVLMAFILCSVVCVVSSASSITFVLKRTWLLKGMGDDTLIGLWHVMPKTHR